MVGIGPKHPRSRRGKLCRSPQFFFYSQNCVGSLADVPQNLLDEIKHFEQIFTVDTAKLKQVSDHFVKELEKGGLSIAYQSELHADQYSH